ncbi:MAG: hypothetical protein NTU44_11500 [Bacteroidetes bacterium]|nr:hypothetical protein [Bacteroidota bacterium]
MQNKDQVRIDLSIAFDFVGQILQKPEILDSIPPDSSISFVDNENPKKEMKRDEKIIKKYVKIKRQFEML